MSLGQWVADVGTAALVGSARREPPPAPGALSLTGEGTAEERLLASAALLDVLTRAGTPLAPPDDRTRSAPAEVRDECREQAAQLLHLLLTQPPVTKVARDQLVGEWLRLADDAGQRVPWWLLPTLLDFAVERPHVARDLGGALGRVIGERGAWLVGLNPAWADATTDGAPQAIGGEQGEPGDWVEAWPTLPSAEAVTAFDTGRRMQPDRARELLEREWDAVPAKVRAAAVRSLRHGVSSDDEPLLERGLDDRSKTVRDAAAEVLARLTDSARGRRMAARLRELVRVRGTLSRHLEVEVPEPPDDAAVRDGLTAPAKSVTVLPTTWLAQIVRGAPLDTWTDITGRSVEATLRMVRDKDVLAWLADATLEQRDTAWAVAMVDHGVPDQRLVWLLPRDRRAELLATWVRKPPPGRDLRSLLTEVPRPWPDALGREVLAALRRPERATSLGYAVAPLLPVALSPALAPAIAAAIERVPADATHLRKSLTETLQLHAFRTSLTEAFK